MPYELIPERIQWHMDLIDRLQRNKIALDAANNLIVETMANWFGDLKHEVSDLSWVRFDTRILDFNTMNPRLNVTVLNNKVIHMLRQVDVDKINREKIEKEIFLHFEDLKRMFASLSDDSGEIFGWTYGVNPRLSKLYREYKS